MLELVIAAPFGMFRKTEDPSGFQVLIVFVDIGIGMVEHIVLYLPIVDIPCQDIDAAAHNSVHPFFGGVGAMVAIVHHVHSHAGHSYAHHYGKQKIGPIGEAKGKYQKIRGKKEGEHYRRL
jgi:hypothetical protein